MVNNLDTFEDACRNPGQWARKYKETTGRKVVGHFPMYAPEELIHAAGLLPVHLHGTHEAITAADAYLEALFCAPLRRMFDCLLKKQLDFADGLFFLKTCNETEHMAEIAQMLSLAPWVHFMRRPYTLFKATWQEELRRRMYQGKLHLEELVGYTITDDALRRSISIYNKNRALLRSLSALRKKSPGILRAGEMASVVASGMVMLREEHSLLLEKLLSELESKTGQAKGVRVVLAGGICDGVGRDVLEVVESSGFVVCGDDLYFGERYFRDDVSSEGQPVEALIRYHWEKSPCTCSQEKEARTLAPYLIQMVRSSGAMALINFRWKYCAYQAYERPYLSDSFQQAGIPYFEVTLGEDSTPREQLRSRLEAFREIVEKETANG